MYSKGNISLDFLFKSDFLIFKTLTLSFKDEIAFPLQVGWLLGLAGYRQCGFGIEVGLKFSSFWCILSTVKNNLHGLLPKKGSEYH